MLLVKNTQKKVKVNVRRIKWSAAIIRRVMKVEHADLRIWVTDNPMMAHMNLYDRKTKGPTDVLSYPGQELKIGECPTPDEHGVNELGDLVMSMPYIRSYCKKRHKEVYPWVDRLIVHGVCHLLGYDHMNDPDEKVMRDREKSVMAEMKEIMAKEPLPPAPPKVAKKTKKTAGDVATSLSP